MMFETMQKILANVDCSYADLRYEEMKDEAILFKGPELTRIGSNSTSGYVVRVLKNGGLASVAFTNLKDAEKALLRATENALLMGSQRRKPVELARVKPVQGMYQPELKEDPRTISLSEKLDLIRTYNDIPLQHENIVTTITYYHELIREKYFINTEGSRLKEDMITTQLYAVIKSQDGTNIQDIAFAIGGSNGFSKIRHRESLFEQRSRVALDLLKAEPVSGGVYNCLLDPELAAVFTHEAFGHFSEADIIENLPALRAKMQRGAPIGSEKLSITDDATLTEHLGAYKYDDEGIPARPVALMTGGVLTGRLHSRRTAVEFDEPLSGHCIAQDYRYAPIVRMGTIFIEPGGHSFEHLLQDLGSGLYLIESNGGETSGENFTFGAQYGYHIKNGKLGKMIRDINISGNLYQSLKDITAIGKELVISEAGGCGKGQSNIHSCMGSPPVLIKNLVIGGV
ncbi:TldD/PmbA family protein [candidate division CSSED10-310 bacterium]|uniref:TldD/PmbA family protein n=1 Tax=candidate division CSSED10-310 bacterium TaxID=2855610 RepID=A0ABV6YZH9_UNCC1